MRAARLLSPVLLLQNRGRLTAVLFEMHDEWIAFPRRYLSEGSMDELYPELPESAPAPPNATNKPTS
ncbi:hypothetical protein ACFW1M_40655 [Streptomyces inhibens]|uniref:hypothetical protein n=1 Tax=Streptomyces inhibens TaxID=2293571 RepID=UPI0036A29CAC